MAGDPTSIFISSLPETSSARPVMIGNDGIDFASFLGQCVQRTGITAGKTLSARTQRRALINRNFSTNWAAGVWHRCMAQDLFAPVWWLSYPCRKGKHRSRLKCSSAIKPGLPLSSHALSEKAVGINIHLQPHARRQLDGCRQPGHCNNRLYITCFFSTCTRARPRCLPAKERQAGQDFGP